MYLLYLKEEFAFYKDDGLKQKELQPLIQNNAVKCTYTKFGMKPLMVPAEVKAEDDIADFESESELDWSGWDSLEEAGSSTQV